ncbi:MAG TPA: DUF2244 domain-containing protein [Beijerinckiaceae bacterium]|nr:DUF2244 domain-containing protein [Beijerinckiaceae bacterium]
MPVFAATLRPNRPLGRSGVALVVGFVALIATVTAIPFIVAGAWPIGGFFGLDVALLYGAFRISSRRAQAYEEVVLSRLELCLRKVDWRGRAREWRFNPFWARLRTREQAEFGLTDLAIVEHGREVAVGSFLGPQEKQEFARALDCALADARR